jgi:hypothetical protein
MYRTSANLVQNSARVVHSRESHRVLAAYSEIRERYFARTIESFPSTTLARDKYNAEHRVRAAYPFVCDISLSFHKHGCMLFTGMPRIGDVGLPLDED